MENSNDIDVMVRELILSDSIETKQKITNEIFNIAKSKGIYLSSIHSLYRAFGEGKCSGFTVPAINLRTLTYYLAKAIFRVAIKNNAGAFIFEIAKSEMGYTGQPPVEYTGVILAAAIKEGYSGPVFVQGDHFQIKAKNFTEDPEKEISIIKNTIEDAVSAGFLNIDLDCSTVVDLEKEDVTEQQRNNFESCAELTQYIRKVEPPNITVSVGGEIGEVGGKNSTVEELKCFMDNYLAVLPDGMEGISKISVQSGTSHGGVVLADGSLAQVKVDFNVLKELSKIGREHYNLGGTVQHGASTLPLEAFGKIPENDALEIHLATGFQNMMFESALFPNELKNRIYDWMKKNLASEWKEGMSEDQFLYKLRKKSLGPFKKDIMNLSEGVKEGIAKEIEAQFDFLFKQLRVTNTKETVDKFIQPKDFKLVFKSKAVLDGEGDD